MHKIKYISLIYILNDDTHLAFVNLSLDTAILNILEYLDKDFPKAQFAFGMIASETRSMGIELGRGYPADITTSLMHQIKQLE